MKEMMQINLDISKEWGPRIQQAMARRCLNIEYNVSKKCQEMKDKFQRESVMKTLIRMENSLQLMETPYKGPYHLFIKDKTLKISNLWIKHHTIIWIAQYNPLIVIAYNKITIISKNEITSYKKGLGIWDKPGSIR